MAIPDKLESFIPLSLLHHLRVSAGISGVYQVQPAGTRAFANYSDDDWIELHVLQIDKRPSSRNEYIALVRWQVTCFSRTADKRADNDSGSCWKVAAAVRKAFDFQIVDIKSWSDSSVDVLIGGMLAHVDDATYLPEPNQNEPGSGGGGPDQPSGVHAVALTISASISIG